MDKQYLLPDISVIIPTYNYAHYIIEAINSILQQDYPQEKVEIIVVDDGSTDNTSEVLHEFISSKTIQYSYQENKGKASATYKAIQKCSGKYIFNLDADDYFLPDKLKYTVNIFEDDASIVHVASPARQIMPDGSCRVEPIPGDIVQRKLEGAWLLERFMNANLLVGGGSTYAARSSALKSIEIPDAVDMYIDEFLVLAILSLGNSFFINECLSVWRGHGFNYSVESKKSEVQLAKSKRLLASSDGVLLYLKNNNYNEDLVNIYRLKNATHHLSYKESLNAKNLKDIALYASEVFLYIRPNWNLIKKYHVINRLLPTSIFNFLKKTFLGSNKKFISDQVA
ncbi:MAG TPA: glycosyltransferase [Parafilimonas sp.]|nr:glycosyltransferase [Parafilimonas sp.]